MRNRALQTAAGLFTALSITACSTGYEMIPGVSVGPPGGGAALAGLEFLSGCWRGMGPGGATREEYFSVPAGGVMLGISRMTQDGALESFEYTLIERNLGRTVLRRLPQGELSPTVFVLGSDFFGGAMAPFRAPENDFPKQIQYQLADSDLLQILMNNGNDDERGYNVMLVQVPCTG